MKKTLLRDCLRKAKEKNATHPQKFKHYTFIIQDNKILEYGVNRSAEPLVEHGYPAYGKIHSENDAYRKAKGLLLPGKWEAVNIRLSKKGLTRLSLPCSCCASYLRELGCAAVTATTDYGWARVVL